MQAKKVKFYFYGDPGPYDERSPAFACSRDQAGEIVYALAANPPFTVTKEKLMAVLELTESQVDTVINSLAQVAAIVASGNTFKLNFAVFLEEDMLLIDRCLSSVGQSLGRLLTSQREVLYAGIDALTSRPYFSRDRLLYHVLCDQVLDGTAFPFLVEQGVLLESKPQPGGRDYLIFAYEESELMSDKSDRLLCSSNNYTVGDITFNSFGDANGSRRDMFRFFRLIVKAIELATPFKAANLAYVRVLEDEHRRVALRCGELLQSLLQPGDTPPESSEEQAALSNLLIELGYLTKESVDSSPKICVPVFRGDDACVIKNLTETVMQALLQPLLQLFDELQKNSQSLTALRHGVAKKEVANELWHQIFGLINEYLVEDGFVERPPEIPGEGRYLRSIQIGMVRSEPEQE